MIPLGASVGYGSSAISKVMGSGVTGKKTSKTPYGDLMADITKQQQEYYNQEYRPVAQGLIKDTQSTAIVDAATKVASIDSSASIKARRDRQKARLGIAADGVSTSLGDYKTAIDRSTQTDGSINEARLQQDERNTALTNDLVGVSRGIATDAMNGMQSAATNESNRNMTNANAKAQNTAARNNLFGSAASLALMLLI